MLTDDDKIADDAILCQPFERSQEPVMRTTDFYDLSPTIIIYRRLELSYSQGDQELRLKMAKPSYGNLAEIIALELFPLFELNHKGRMECEHFASNDFDLPCDILARLGILNPESAGHSHEFNVQWQPGEPLPIARNASEPSYDDLVTAFIRAFRWWSYELKSRQCYVFDAANIPPPPSDRRFCSDETITYRRYTHSLVLEALVQLDLGEWLEDEVFVLNEHGDAIRVPGNYWTLVSTTE